MVSIVFIAAAVYARGASAPEACGLTRTPRTEPEASFGRLAPESRHVARPRGPPGRSAWLVASWLGRAHPLEVLLVTAVPNPGVAIPSSPGFIGTYQWLGVAALGNLGVGHADAFAFSVLMHAAWYLPTTFAGVVLALRKVPPAVAGALATKDFRFPRARAARRGSAPPGLTGSVSPTPPARDR